MLAQGSQRVISYRNLTLIGTAGILQMRLYALFSLNKKILALLISFFLITTATAGWIMGSVLSTLKGAVDNLFTLVVFILLDTFLATALTLPTGGKFCVPANVPGHFYLFWIPLLAYECLLCALALIRGFQTFKSSGTGLFQSGRHLVAVLVRDSLMYFFV